MVAEVVDDASRFETLKVGVLVRLEGPPEAGYETYCGGEPTKMNLVPKAVFAWVRALGMKTFPVCRTGPPVAMAKTVVPQATVRFVCLPHSPTSS